MKTGFAEYEKQYEFHVEQGTWFLLRGPCGAIWK